MRRLVLKAGRISSVIREISGMSGSFSESLDTWMRDRFIYTEDVPVEVIRTPENMIEAINKNGYFVGDCDDATILACYIAKCAGIQSRMVAIQDVLIGTGFNHVYAELEENGLWKQVDPTVSKGTIVIGFQRMEVLV